MPTFNMAAQTPNGQPGGTEVYTNGIPQTYPARKCLNIITKQVVLNKNAFKFYILFVSKARNGELLKRL